MSVFSTNQNRQMYVVTAQKSSVAKTDAAGTIAVKSNTAKTEMYFNYVGADKTVMRSDLIKLDSIMYAKATPAAYLKLQLKSVKVSLAGDLIPGEDYILRINIQQAFGKGDDTTYQKFGAVRATSGMTPESFWAAMKQSLERNFSKELTEWFTFKADATFVEPFIVKHGPIFDKRGVRVSVCQDRGYMESSNIIEGVELWLLEDMTFAATHFCHIEVSNDPQKEEAIYRYPVDIKKAVLNDLYMDDFLEDVQFIME